MPEVLDRADLDPTLHQLRSRRREVGDDQLEPME
jgi:hypothetical protein